MDDGGSSFNTITFINSAVIGTEVIELALNFVSVAAVFQVRREVAEPINIGIYQANGDMPLVILAMAARNSWFIRAADSSSVLLKSLIKLFSWSTIQLFCLRLFRHY